MVPHRPRYAIGGRSRRPLFGLFPRHRWYGQPENGTPPDTCERFLVSGVGTPNLHQVASMRRALQANGRDESSAFPRSVSKA